MSWGSLPPFLIISLLGERLLVFRGTGEVFLNRGAFLLTVLLLPVLVTTVDTLGKRIVSEGSRPSLLLKAGENLACDTTIRRC